MALIITRRTNEAFYVGDDIKVTVIATKGGQANDRDQTTGPRT